ncbi:hypothetical protein Fuma_00972 [Fuerstiella marisgermanici]|uniref:Uncharacterized protein n=1 Tax=Fuerstiella marisgermanici TaxID=1891926 RepID=A0A1P8WBD6_9PLAN|nr:hypothetical protein Fuma_00972 [Fuerstiella marisgermanici]
MEADPDTVNDRDPQRRHCVAGVQAAALRLPKTGSA